MTSGTVNGGGGDGGGGRVTGKIMDSEVIAEQFTMERKTLCAAGPGQIWLSEAGPGVKGRTAKTTIDYYIKQTKLFPRWKEGKSLTRKVQLSGK